MSRIERECEVLATLIMCENAYQELPEEFNVTAFESHDYQIIYQLIKDEFIDKRKPVQITEILKLNSDLQPLLDDVLYGQKPLNGNLKPKAKALLRHSSDISVSRMNVEESPVLSDTAQNQTLSLSEVGNAERFVQLHSSKLRYVSKWERWLIWNGKYWKQDEKGEVFERAKETIRGIYGEAENCQDENQRKALVKFALQSESHQHISSMLKLVRTDRSVAINASDLDKNQFVLNLENGTFDLNLDVLFPHMPEDLITKYIDVTYKPAAEATHWNDFLLKIFNGNSDLIRFVQRCVGYSLSGDTSEQCLFFCYGSGMNGKSVFCELTKMLMGDYAQKAPSEMLMLKRNETIPSDLARLQGARFVVASEIQQGRRMNEAKVKDLTGGDTIVARYMYGDYFEFTPTHKLWMYGNHKPVINGTDEGIWRRIVLIPFNVTIPESERVPMGEFLDKFRGELSGILNWALEGFREYKRAGLQKPAEVSRATENYRNEMDVLGEFMEEKCIVDHTKSVKAKEVFNSYQCWCNDNGETPVKRREFDNSLKERGMHSERGTGNNVEWRGIGLAESYI